MRNTACMYLRLSRERDSNESNSISNQETNNQNLTLKKRT